MDSGHDLGLGQSRRVQDETLYGILSYLARVSLLVHSLGGHYSILPPPPGLPDCLLLLFKLSYTYVQSSRDIHLPHTLCYIFEETPLARSPLGSLTMNDPLELYRVSPHIADSQHWMV